MLLLCKLSHTVSSSSYEYALATRCVIRYFCSNLTIQSRTNTERIELYGLVASILEEPFSYSVSTFSRSCRSSSLMETRVSRISFNSDEDGFVVRRSAELSLGRPRRRVSVGEGHDNRSGASQTIVLFLGRPRRRG